MLVNALGPAGVSVATNKGRCPVCRHPMTPERLIELPSATECKLWYCVRCHIWWNFALAQPEEAST
jgi:hypothetical protein